MDSNPQTINCNRCRKSRKCDTGSAVAAGATLLDRVGFPGPRGTPRYHTFVIYFIGLSLTSACCSNNTHPWLFRLYERGSILSQIVMNFLATILFLLIASAALVAWPFVLIGSAFLCVCIAKLLPRYYNCFGRSLQRSDGWGKACSATLIAWAAVILAPLGLAAAVALFYAIAFLLAGPALVYLVCDLLRYLSEPLLTNCLKNFEYTPNRGVL